MLKKTDIVRFCLYLYFYYRQHVLFPFKVVDRINKFDMEIEVNKGGLSCLAKALRYSISKALCSFVSSENIEKLRLGKVFCLEISLQIVKYIVFK